MNNNKKCIAIYIRAASANQASISTQEAQLRQYAARKGYTELRTYTDNGLSGMNFERPALRQLIDDIESGKIEKVLTRDISRISRDYNGILDFNSILERNGVELYTPNDFREFNKSQVGKFLNIMKDKNRSNKDRER
jgi:DNA invertase Pin-like site-specific DNA recombinase